MKNPLREKQKAVRGKVGPNGRALCCWCQAEVPKGRRSWCGDACVDDYRGHHDWAYIRAKVFERDKGICAECSLDCVADKEKFRTETSGMNIFRRKEAVQTLGIDRHRIHADWWDAHHVVPRASGGDNSLGNLITLCVACHKAAHGAVRED